MMRAVESIKFHINGEKYYFRPPEKDASDTTALLAFMVAAISQGKIDAFDLAQHLEDNGLWKYFKKADDDGTKD